MTTFPFLLPESSENGFQTDQLDKAKQSSKFPHILTGGPII